MRKVRRDVSVTPKTKGQEELIRSVLTNEITICNGPAGTGKTLIAVGLALQLMREYPEKFKKLIMVRPYVAVEGEDMGFLPGDLEDKMRPFVAPMFDSLDFFLDKGEISSLRDSGTIEIIPIGFMRGRTINNAVIVFDEAQNSTWNQMVMFLTRIGFDCKAIVEGDVSQSDLANNKDMNGLKLAADKLRGVEGVAVVSLEGRDIVRSPIVKKILGRLT